MMDITPTKTVDNSKDNDTLSHNKEKQTYFRKKFAIKKIKKNKNSQANNTKTDETMIMFDDVEMINIILRMIEHGAEVIFKNN